MNNRILLGGLGGCVLLGIGIIIGHFAIPQSSDTDIVSNTGNFSHISILDQTLELRRTTLCVYNLTRSLQFYEGALGMTRIYGN